MQCLHIQQHCPGPPTSPRPQSPPTLSSFLVFAKLVDVKRWAMEPCLMCISLITNQCECLFICWLCLQELSFVNWLWLLIVFFGGFWLFLVDFFDLEEFLEDLRYWSLGSFRHCKSLFPFYYVLTFVVRKILSADVFKSINFFLPCAFWILFKKFLSNPKLYTYLLLFLPISILVFFLYLSHLDILSI